MNEAPLELTLLQLTLIPVEVAHVRNAGRDLTGQVADVVVEFRVAPLFVFELLHHLQDAQLDNLLGKCRAAQQVLEHREREADDLLDAAVYEHVTKLLDQDVLLEVQSALCLEGKQPHREDALVEVRGRSVLCRNRGDGLGHTGQLPEQSPKGVRLEEVDEGVEDTELAASAALALEALHEAPDLGLGEEAGCIPDDRGQEPSSLVGHVLLCARARHDVQEFLVHVDLLAERLLEEGEAAAVLAQHVADESQDPPRRPSILTSIETGGDRATLAFEGGLFRERRRADLHTLERRRDVVGGV
mmetsp:Transcript_101272/g.257590  ORF Transcript_101272/g.257590 Transcript_101272/m.257590 type:complete len:301 (-) Transcript_101272:175-1077(-)